jgi:hypothetical protein
VLAAAWASMRLPLQALWRGTRSVIDTLLLTLCVLGCKVCQGRYPALGM